MKPTPELYAIVVGVIARAQRRFPVEVCGIVVLSNHYHLLLWVPDSRRLADFMCFVNSNLAREAGRLVAWCERFWARRYQAIVVSDEEEAQVARLKYLLSHGCKEGLVARPQDWPGVHAVNALLEGRPLAGRWLDRTRGHLTRARGQGSPPEVFATDESLIVEPLPCWRHLSPQQIRQRVQSLLDEIEAEAVTLQKEKRPLGIETLRRQDPHSAPVRSKKSPAPAFHAATRAAHRALREAYRHFVASFRDAAERLRAGDLSARFPPGSFPPALPFVEVT